jgi:hypothetical protein
MEQQNPLSSAGPVDMTVADSDSDSERADVASSNADDSDGEEFGGEGFDAETPDIELYNIEGLEGSDGEGFDVEGSEGEAFGSDDFEVGISDVECYHVEDSDVEDSTPRLQTFNLFPKLPIEIRCMIWRATFPGPQLHVWSNVDGACCERIGLLHLRIPIALSVNKESRTEALNSYKKLEEGEQRCKCYRNRLPYVFFNKETDTLRTEPTMSVNGRLGEFCTVHFAKPSRDILSQVQYLEIEEFAPQPFRPIPHGNLKDFRTLKELTFIPVFFVWDEDDLTGDNAQAFINVYRDFFTKLATEDPTRTIPKIAIAEPEREAKCEWYYEDAEE